MKTNHRRKTFGFERNNAQGLKQRRKHNSTFSFIQEEAGRVVVLDIIQHLLGKVYEEEIQRTKFLLFMMKKLAAMQAEDSIYFNLENADEQEILCHEDAEPPAQENRSLEVVKNVSHLKKSSKLKFGEENLDLSQTNEMSRMSIVDPDKKDRDSIIQKLKREYSMILQSKYLSESTPIGESRSFFMEGDTPDITYMRSNFGKASNNAKKTQKHKPSFVQEQLRRNHKLDTIFKKSRDYVETIDPTMSNSIYLSQVQPQTSTHRASVVNPPLLPQEPSVIVKLSKLKDVSNVISTKNEVVSQKNIAAEATYANTKFTNIVAEQERQSLKLRVERSFHSSNKTHFREVPETQRKPRLNNAISVSFLPRISRI